MLQLFDSDEKPFFVAKKLAPSISLAFLVTHDVWIALDSLVGLFFFSAF